MSGNKNRIGENWNYFVEIQFFFDSFTVYRTRINELIEAERNNARQRYAQYMLTFSEFHELENDFEWFEHFAAINIGVSLRDIYYDSMIMVLYSFLEKKLHYLCKYLEKDFTVKVDDIAGKGIFKYKTFLTKVANIDLTEIENEWHDVKVFNVLRNFIVHSEGTRFVPKRKIDFINMLNKLPGVKVDDFNELNVKFRFVNDESIVKFQNTVRKIIDYVHKQEIGSD